MTQSTLQKANERLSNIELLRIIAMTLVLVVHADSFSLGCPQDATSINSITRMVFQCLAVTCVDIFVLISGWFGINPTIKGAAKYLFQWLFFSIGIYVCMTLWGHIPFNKEGFTNCFIFNIGGYWFVGSYLILYFLSPVLNAGINNIKREQLKWIIIIFFLFQSIFSWCFLHSEFAHGYSTISFIGLYLLARYIKIYQPSFINYKRIYYLITFGGLILLNTVFLGIAIFLHRGGIPTRIMMFYDTPTTIMASLALLLFFSKLDIRSRFVNWVASSCFAVYLLHTHYLLLGKYADIVRHLYDTYYGVKTLIMIGAFIVLTFMISIIIDQIRKVMWNITWFFISNRCKNVNKQT